MHVLRGNACSYNVPEKQSSGGRFRIKAVLFLKETPIRRFSTSYFVSAFHLVLKYVFGRWVEGDERRAGIGRCMKA